MPVEDVFRLNQGRIVMAAGQIERGRVRRGDEVEFVGFGAHAIACVAGIDASRQRLDEASAGMNVGLLVSGAAAGTVERGQVLAAPGSISAYVAFAAEIALLSEEQGGADVHTGAVLDFYIRSGGVRGVVTLLSHGVDTLQPLHMAAVSVMLERPVALEIGQSFPFRHLGRAAGSGTVTRLLHT
ncbi:EF-Tu/IF-2/RF-3 family GTPase [Streptomyces sp. NPDC002888]|uniref:EF-Tu/IF-2/RF-3 family GTPase n=1 Tax=Streptomyces sp. NPDC002888 TaxID=3364668 RepID=UPI0036875E72